MKNSIQDMSLMSFLQQEQNRQAYGINLIASENYASQEILNIVGSVFSNKYIEGYPGKRYYSGCHIYDEVEVLAIERFKKLFKAEHVNVQPHSGSQANAAVYLALLQPGDIILSMSLSSGGHLSHGNIVNWTHQIYNIVSYCVDRETYLLDYSKIEELAIQVKPKLIIAGASAYSRVIDFEKIALIAQKVEAFFMADIAHLAGFIAAGLHPSPIQFADVVTMTTHKTFRGPRGGLIMCKKELANKIDKMLMPGMQGGALMNNVAAKAVAAFEAMQPDFLLYQQQVLKNSRAMAKEFLIRGYNVLTHGTDNHMILIDLTSTGLDGRKAELLLESVGVFVNRNTIPFDINPPLRPSGIRLGSAAITTKGCDENDMKFIVSLIDQVIKFHHHEDTLEKVRLQVEVLMIGLLKK